MKKIFKCIICALVVMFSFVLCACDLTTPETPQSPEPELSVEQVEFNSLLSRVTELELLSQNYNDQDSTLRALIYIRSEKYNTSEWETLCGEIDSSFNSYVLTNQVKDVSGLKKYDTFVVPVTNQSVDFVHMVATLNGVYYNSENAGKDLVGWGGDLCQLASEVKQTGKSGNELSQLIETTFNSSNGGFNSADVCADIDAVNIGTLLKQNNRTIAQAMKNYYENLTVNTQKSGFIKNVFGTEILSLAQLKSTMYSRVLDNFLLNVWSYKHSLSFTDSEDCAIIKQCCDVFADFLWNN